MRNPFLSFTKPSTRAFWKEAVQRPGGSVREALHGLFYLKWPEFYIGIGLGRGRVAPLLRRAALRAGGWFGLWKEGAGARFADTYHGKVMPMPQAARLIRVERPLRVRVPEKVLPYGLARDIVLENSEDLALLRCPCRASAVNPCQPLDVCIIVGQPFVDFVLEHHPAKARRVGVDEAVEVLRAAVKRGHVSHAFFKEAMLGRYYAVCNCCPCCCGAMQAHRDGTPMLASSGYAVRVDEGVCAGCGVCAGVCPFKAIGMEGERPVIDMELCMGCGVCAAHCAKGALSLRLSASGLAPLECG